MASRPAKHTLATSIFPYQPINEADGIRLIQLLPASSAEDEVQCELTHTTLANCTDIYEHYTALSYVWGNQFNTKRVWVDQVPVQVTYSLYSALRDIRHESKTLQIWADAICINQRDDEEKLRQISMMGRIYSSADHTVIYLGLSNPQDAAKLDGWVSSNFDKSQFNTEIADLILSHTWFRRVWVFQELVFSKDPRVQVGRHRFSWNALYYAANPRVKGDSPDTDRLDVAQGPKLLVDMHQARQERHAQEKARMDAFATRSMPNHVKKRHGLRMIDLLGARRGLGVKFAKDMIFAHLGFASDGAELTERINYSMTWAQVYHAFARYMIDKGLHWYLFDEIGDRDISTGLDGLASWAPDWSITSSAGLRVLDCDCCSIIFNDERTEGDFLSDEEGSPSTDAIRHAFIREPPLLACLGAKLDVVAQVGDGVRNSITRLDKPYRECSEEKLLSCWLWVIKPHVDEHSTLKGFRKDEIYGIIHGSEPDFYVCRLFMDIWESLGDNTEFGANKFFLEHVVFFHLTLIRTVVRCRRRSSGIVALTGNGSFVLVPN